MADKSLRIAALQLDLQWHQPAPNYAKADSLLAQFAGPYDVILLPEMFATGFTMEAAEVAESSNGPSVSWMQSIAARCQAIVGGSLVIREQDRYVNRFFWVTEHGVQAQYDKRHLFAMAGEDRPYEAGDSQLIIEWKGWRIMTQICYDLRFPVWNRNNFDPSGGASYDLMVNVANWPKPRIAHWDALLKARAIENLAYVAGVNRVGTDENGIEYVGSSQIIAYDGEILTSSRNQETILVAELDADLLKTYRRKFPFWKEADEFTLK